MSKLTISLWDFTWYTRTGPGEPFEDLDHAFAEAVARGYNTVRVCAMPYLLFGSGLDTSALTFGPFGRGYGLGMYDRYAVYHHGMAEKLRLWIEVAGDWAAARDLPLVFGEGWVGYTPLRGTFEEGAVGADICLQAVTRARQVGAWGTVVCSNAAPQHPMWADVELQQRANALFTGEH